MSRSKSIVATLRTPDAMPRRRHVLFATAASVVALPSRGQPMKIRLGTATPGGGFPVYGAAFVEGVRRFDAGLDIEAVNTKGSTENVPMLEAGRLDIALVQGEVVHESLSGIGRPPANLLITTAMYPTAGMFVVRADSPKRRCIRLPACSWCVQILLIVPSPTSRASSSPGARKVRVW